MILFWIAVIAFFWTLMLIFLFLPDGFFADKIDRLQKGQKRPDRHQLQMILDHLRSFPDEWSVSDEGAHFPKTGAKQTSLMYDDKKGWQLYQNNFGGKARNINGHFGQEIASLITEENNRREKAALMRQFFPGLDGPLLLK